MSNFEFKDIWQDDKGNVDIKFLVMVGMFLVGVGSGVIAKIKSIYVSRNKINSLLNHEVFNYLNILEDFGNYPEDIKRLDDEHISERKKALIKRVIGLKAAKWRSALGKIIKAKMTYKDLDILNDKIFSEWLLEFISSSEIEFTRYGIPDIYLVRLNKLYQEDSIRGLLLNCIDVINNDYVYSTKMIKYNCIFDFIMDYLEKDMVDASIKTAVIINGELESLL